MKQYADWFRYNYPQQAIDEDNADKLAEQAAGDGTKPRNGIRSKWEKYRKEFGASQVSLFTLRLIFIYYGRLLCIKTGAEISCLASDTV